MGSTSIIQLLFQVGGFIQIGLMLIAAGYLVYKWPSTGSILILVSVIISLIGRIGLPILVRTSNSMSISIIIQSIYFFSGMLMTLGILMLAINAPRRVKREEW